MKNSHNTQATLRSILPYSYIVGQEKLKLALELAYIAPGIGGVLISGQRGTAKSTTARAFATMMYKKLPVTIPINATEDRVVGGWNVPKLLKEGTPEEQPGLLQEAHEGMLYIDEVNLLDDHIVNIILDVTSTGKLVVQREGINEQYDVRTTLVGTMNPEEGSLRPQLLDRFGLMVAVETITDRGQRRKILDHVLRFDQALAEERDKKTTDTWLAEGWKQTEERRTTLEQAKKRLYSVQMAPEVPDVCVQISEAFGIDGHRGDYLLAMAACAYAAREQVKIATLEHLGTVAELVLRHRQQQGEPFEWNTQQEQRVSELLVHG
jgi:magnesium chelatase subunit I